MKESKFVKAVIAAVAVAAISLPAISSADETGSDELKGRSEKVNYADLDVRKEEGAEVLYRRLQQASKRVCDVDSNSVGSVRQLSENRLCYRETLDRSVAKVNNPALTAIHEG